MQYLNNLIDSENIKMQWLIWGSLGERAPTDSDGYQMVSAVGYDGIDDSKDDVSGGCVEMLMDVGDWKFNATASICHYVSGGKAQSKYLTLEAWERMTDAAEKGEKIVGRPGFAIPHQRNYP
jgi:hypothetical protein